MANNVQPNWMSSVDLGTYKFTLYVVNHNIWNDPSILQNDSAALRSGQAVVIAESGVTGGYGIDNVVFQSKVAGNLISGSIATGIVQFDLHEPLAFKFLDRILTFSSLLGLKTVQTAFYVLKLELQGKNIKSGSPVKYPGVFFYPLMFQSVRANVTVRGTSYNIIAGNFTGIAMMESVVKQAVTVNNIATLDDYRANLESTLNEVYMPKLMAKDPEAQQKPPYPKTIYRIVFDEEFTKRVSPSSPWQGLNAPDKAGGLSTDINNADARIATFQPEDNLTKTIREHILKNSPTFKEYSEKMKAENITPVISVQPKVILEDKVDKTTNEVVKVLEIRISIYETKTKPPPEPEEHEALLRNYGKQVKMFNEAGIVKKYSYLYSGENIELLDLNVEFNMLFAAARLPLSGKLYPEPSKQTVGANLDKSTGNDNSSQAVTSGSQLKLKGNSSYSPYLEDINVESGVLIESLTYMYDTISAARMQVTDTTQDDKTMDVLLNDEWKQRIGDMIKAEITIKGDPFWLGTPGYIMGYDSSSLTDNMNIDTSLTMHDTMHKGDIFIALTNYNPNEGIAEPGHKFSREMDLITSGVYAAYEVETKFQSGEFTHRISLARNQNISTYYVKELLDKL